MQLYGRKWSAREFLARVGRVEQCGGLRRLAATEGPEAGTEAIELRTGAGWRCVILPARGLDISLAEFGGAPLTWQAAGGEPHPAFHEPAGLGFLRTAAGGLLMTCGMTNVGSPNADAGEELGLHGRYHHLPARQVAAEGWWENDEYEMRVAGVIEEVRLFGHHLRCRREIRARLGENRLWVRDEIENAGFAPAPWQMLYHCNFGFPLLTPRTKLEFPAGRLSPRDGRADPARLNCWADPDPQIEEGVYYLQDLRADSAGWVQAVLANPEFPLPAGPAAVSLAVRWRAESLPNLVVWRMPGAGAHVLGIEPANCLVGGRAAERERGTLIELAPGERQVCELEFVIS